LLLKIIISITPPSQLKDPLMRKKRRSRRREAEKDEV
jgi:hypothetical protein